VARIVAVSPTLSEAIQSVGGTLARHASNGHEAVVVAVFADGSEDGWEQAASQCLGLAGVVRIGARVDMDDAGTAVGAALAVSLSQLEPGLVLSPIGLSGEEGVRIVNDALDALSIDRLRWVDLPYALTRTPGAPLGTGEVVATPITDHLEVKLAACALIPGTTPDRLRTHADSEGDRLGVGEAVELLLDRSDAEPAL
jgi:hypothetical protein